MTSKTVMVGKIVLQTELKAHVKLNKSVFANADI
jgi:hypothetical protein